MEAFPAPAPAKPAQFFCFSSLQAALLCRFVFLAQLPDLPSLLPGTRGCVALPQTRGFDHPSALPPGSHCLFLFCFFLVFLQKARRKTFLNRSESLISGSDASPWRPADLAHLPPVFMDFISRRWLEADRSLPSASLINIEQFSAGYLKASISPRGCSKSTGELRRRRIKSNRL